MYRMLPGLSCGCQIRLGTAIMYVLAFAAIGTTSFQPLLIPSTGLAKSDKIAYNDLPGMPMSGSEEPQRRPETIKSLLKIGSSYFSRRLLSEISTIEAIYFSQLNRASEEFRKLGAINNREVSLAKKAVFWDYFGPFYNCDSRERVGRIGDGGKWVCGVRTFLKNASPCVVYSIGSDGETSFESAVREQLPHCEVHVFDPTLTQEKKRLVQEIEGINLHEIGLAGKSGKMKIGRGYPMTSRNVKRSRKYVGNSMDLTVLTLSDAMKKLNHSWINVLKIDIDGWEWEMFESIFENGHTLPATQVQIELHWPRNVSRVALFFSNMQRHGFRVFSVEPNYYSGATQYIEYSFLHVDDATGQIVTGP